MLKNKRQPIAEIEMTLFQYCPYDCSFCKHDKKDVTGMSLIEMSSKYMKVNEFRIICLDIFFNKFDNSIMWEIGLLH